MYYKRSCTAIELKSVVDKKVNLFEAKFEEEFFKLKIEIQSKTQRSLLMGSVKLTLNRIILISF